MNTQQPIDAMLMALESKVETARMVLKAAERELAEYLKEAERTVEVGSAR